MDEIIAAIEKTITDKSYKLEDVKSCVIHYSDFKSYVINFKNGDVFSYSLSAKDNTKSKSKFFTAKDIDTMRKKDTY